MFDIATYAEGFEELKPYIMHLRNRRPETVRSQQRLLEKWQQNREILHGRTKKDPEEIERWQLERVSFLIDYAFTTHPFYHKLYKDAGYKHGDIVSWKDYHSLPTITKKDILDNYPLFTSNQGQDDSDAFVYRTSGSSGVKLTILFDPAMVDQDFMQCLRYHDQMLGGRRREDEWMYQVYVCPMPFSSLNGKYPIFTVFNGCPPEIILPHLKKVKPALLTGFPSTFLRLGEIVDDPKQLGIKAISINSEPSTVAERQKISELFDAPVFDEYASNELALIATQCKKGKYHIVEDNVRVDVLNPDATGMGEIVATNLHNTFMPFIRYRQGDQIRLNFTQTSCECGNRFRVLDTFLGRSDQTLKSAVKGDLPCDLVMGVYDDYLLNHKAKIREFKLVQTDLKKLELFIVPDKDVTHANTENVAEFIDEMRKLFSDPELEVRVKEGPEIPKGLSHKRCLIENRMPK